MLLLVERLKIVDKILASQLMLRYMHTGWSVEAGTLLLAKRLEIVDKVLASQLRVEIYAYWLRS
jgi:hypothetical protein